MISEKKGVQNRNRMLQIFMGSSDKAKEAESGNARGCRKQVEAAPAVNQVALESTMN